MSGGWIRVWRDEAGRYAFPKELTHQWIDLKLAVAWRREVVKGPRGEWVELKPGQAALSLKQLGRLWNCSVNTAIKHLEAFKLAGLADTIKVGTTSVIAITCVNDVSFGDTTSDMTSDMTPDTTSDMTPDTTLHYKGTINKEEPVRADGVQTGELGLEIVGRAEARGSSDFRKNRLVRGSLTEREKRRRRVEGNDDLMVRVGALLRRLPRTLWTVAEAEALEEVSPGEEEVSLLEAYYLAAGAKDRPLRQDVMTLLNNWAGEVDRARGWVAKHGLAASRARADLRRERAAAAADFEVDEMGMPVSRGVVVPMYLDESMVECV